MLAAKEGVTIDLGRLRKLGEDDLARNLDILELSARSIEPKKRSAPWSTGQGRQAGPRPVLAEATRQAGAMRKFLLDKDLVTIPSDDVARCARRRPS